MDADSLSNSYDLEAGISGGGFNYPSSNNSNSRRRRPSYRNLMGSPSPRTTRSPVAGFFYDSLSDEEIHHFLDSCFLCKRHLAGDSDIFMYRGDTPFCSEECRQQQIEMDEQKEKKWKRDQKQRSSTPKSHQTIHVGAAGTVVG